MSVVAREHKMARSIHGLQFQSVLDTHLKRKKVAIISWFSAEHRERQSGSGKIVLRHVSTFNEFKILRVFRKIPYDFYCDLK